MRQSLSSVKKTNSRWFRLNLWIHRWVSLVVVIPFAILSITGVILIFHEEIDHALGVEPTALSSSQQRPLADSIATAQKTYPNEQVISTGYDPEHHPGVLLIGMAKPNQGFEQARWLFADIGSFAWHRQIELPGPELPELELLVPPVQLFACSMLLPVAVVAHQAPAASH